MQEEIPLRVGKPLFMDGSIEVVLTPYSSTFEWYLLHAAQVGANKNVRQKLYPSRTRLIEPIVNGVSPLKAAKSCNLKRWISTVYKTAAKVGASFVGKRL